VVRWPPSALPLLLALLELLPAPTQLLASHRASCPLLSPLSTQQQLLLLLLLLLLLPAAPH
jgi:hypothetical protein